MKRLLSLLCLLPVAAMAQNTPSHISANTIGRIEGGILVERSLGLPLYDTTAINTLLSTKYSTSPNIIRRQGQLTQWINRIWYYNNKWIAVASEDYVRASIDSIPAANSRTGVSTQSGTGARVTFTIPHGLPEQPSYINISANTQDAGGWRYVNSDSVNLYIYYSVAPAAGADNLRWSWIARP